MKKTLILLSLAAAGLTACGTTEHGADAMTAHEASALEAFVWTLVRVQQPVSEQDDIKSAVQAPAALSPFELQFEDGRVAVLGLCNVLSGAYQMDGAQMAIQPMLSTRKMCSNQQQMETEYYVGQIMPEVTRWQINGLEAQSWAQSKPSLALEFEYGMRWQFQGVPTPQTQYGQAGETVFLEIDGQDAYCAAAEHACYQVRTVNYDAKGLKTNVGSWQRIDKSQLHHFEAQTGASTIIRALRFEPQDQSKAQPVYFYEMTVESTRGD